MSLTLATAKTTLQTHLQDLTSLIFSAATLEEAIRSSLRALNRVSDPDFTISGLDGAASTTITTTEEQLIIEGGVAYALTFRVVDLFEDASPDEDLPKEFSDFAQARMNAFLSLLTQIELGVPVSPDDHAHELAVIAAKHANDLIIQSNDQAHDLAVIAAEHDNDVIIQSAEHTHDDSIQSSDQAHDLAVIAAEHDNDVIIQSAEHTHDDSTQSSDQAHDLAVIAAEQANKKEIILDENNREDAKDAAEKTRLEELQQSADHPYSAWDWEEGTEF